MGACAGVQLPDSLLCIANPQNKVLGCYNLKTDYTYDINSHTLKLNPGATKTYLPLGNIKDVERFTCTNPQGWTNLVTFFNEQQAHCVCQ